jgi:hypothetical protein
MTQQYMIGEFSARLEQLQAVAVRGATADVACLRHEVENSGLSALAPAAVRAIELADTMCWSSLARGDIAAFARQAAVAADLRLFGVCARLLADA